MQLGPALSIIITATATIRGLRAQRSTPRTERLTPRVRAAPDRPGPTRRPERGAVVAAPVASTVSPWFVNLGLEPAELRAFAAGLLSKTFADPAAPEVGVLPGGNNTGLSVIENGTVDSPAVWVGAGHAVLATPTGGLYVCSWPVGGNVLLDVAGSSPRIDVLCGRVRDDDVDGSGVKAFELVAVAGAPSASPTAPAVPAGYLPIADVRVDDTDGVAQIVDRRQFTRAAGGVRFCPESDVARAGAFYGDLRVRVSGALEVYLPGGWAVLASPTGWLEHTPSLYSTSNGTAIANNLGDPSTRSCRYVIVGKTMQVRYRFTSGPGRNFARGDLFTTLPAGLTAAASEPKSLLAARVDTGGAGPAESSGQANSHGTYHGYAEVEPGSTELHIFMPRSQTDGRMAGYSIFTNTGYENGYGIPLIAAGQPLPDELVIAGTVEIA